MLLGVWIMAVSYFGGFPSPWNKLILIASGLLVVLVAYFMKSDAPKLPKKEEHPYIETKTPPAA